MGTNVENEIMVIFDMNTLKYRTIIGGILVSECDNYEEAITDFDELVSDYYLNEVLLR